MTSTVGGRVQQNGETSQPRYVAGPICKATPFAHLIAGVSGKFVIGYPSLQLGFVATFKLELTSWSSSSSRFDATSRPAHDTDTASHLKL